MADIVRQKTLKVYATEDGKEPYTVWLESLKDYVIRSRIIRRIERLKQGNYGDCKSVGSGVQEMRFFFGSGYRVYFGESANDLVILLCGGDKDSQDRDIEKAKGYWQAYQEEQDEQETEKP
jgi:putative addiction module killer protein